MMLVIKTDVTDGECNEVCALSFKTEQEARAWIQQEYNDVEAELIDDGREYIGEADTCRMFGNHKTEWYLRFMTPGTEIRNEILWTLTDPIPAESGDQLMDDINKYFGVSVARYDFPVVFDIYDDKEEFNINMYDGSNNNTFKKLQARGDAAIIDGFYVYFAEGNYNDVMNGNDPFD